MAHLVVDMACETISTYRSVATGRGRRAHTSTCCSPCSWATSGTARDGTSYCGGLHGTYLTIERILRGEGRVAPASWITVRVWPKATWIFVLVTVTWVFSDRHRSRSPAPCGRSRCSSTAPDSRCD